MRLNMHRQKQKKHVLDNAVSFAFKYALTTCRIISQHHVTACPRVQKKKNHIARFPDKQYRPETRQQRSLVSSLYCTRWSPQHIERASIILPITAYHIAFSHVRRTTSETNTDKHTHTSLFMMPWLTFKYFIFNCIIIRQFLVAPSVFFFHFLVLFSFSCGELYGSVTGAFFLPRIYSRCSCPFETTTAVFFF